MRETGWVTWWNSIDTESVSDAGSSNVVLGVTVALVVLGSALLAVTVWFFRSTRPDPDALGPLVVMSERRFASLGPIERRRTLDRARPSSPTDDEQTTDVDEVATVAVGISDESFDDEDVPELDDDEPFDDEVVAEREDELRPRTIDPLL